MTENRENMEAMFVGAKGDTGAQGDKGDKGDRGLRPGQARAIGTILAVLAVVIVVLYLYNLETRRQVDHAIKTNNRQWCHALGLLTATKVPRPADPAANPSRETTYEYYTTFLGLRQSFGCS